MSLDRFRKTGGKIDYWIFFLIFALCIFGLLMIYSSSAVVSFEEYGINNYYFKKQLISLGIGIVFLIITSLIDYRFWQKNATIFFFIATALLIWVILFSSKVSGAQRWIQLGPIPLQPSEIMKLASIIYLAAWFAKKKDQIKNFKYGFIPFIIILGAVSFLIMKQPDMGTTSVVVGIAVIMFFCAGAPMWQMGLGLAGIVSAFLLLIKIEPYRMQRLMVFLNPNSDTLGTGYHISQAMLAIGSGGLFGLGFGQSKQKYLYLPEPHTDSIFAITTEELGFLRAFIIFVVFVLIAVRGLKIAKNAPDQFSRLLVIGIIAWIIIQFFINIGAMIGMLPLTGVPLPFVSYGGSSLTALLAAVGIILNISKQSHR